MHALLDELCTENTNLLTDTVMRSGVDQAIRELAEGPDAALKKYRAHCTRYWDLENPSHELSRFHNGYSLAMERAIGIPFLQNGGGLNGLWRV